MNGWGTVAALVAAVVIHTIALIAWLHIYTPISLRHADSAGSGLHVTLVAPAATPAAPMPPQPVAQRQPTPPQPVAQRQPTRRHVPVLASRSPSRREVAAPTPHPDPAAASLSAPAAPASAVTAQAESLARAQPSLKLPDVDSVKDVARVSCDIPQPSYPPRARRLNHEGTVVMRVTIDPTGRITEVEVSRSSGFDELDAAARQALLAGHCDPYVDSGVPTAVHAMQPIAFHLDD